MAPKIVIVGGSVAGTSVATELDKALGPAADLILVEERDHFYNPMASIRSIVDADFAEKLWIPYTKIFQRNPASKVVRGRASAVDPARKTLKLASGDEIAFDYLVVATGTRLESPWKTARKTKAEGKAESDRIVEAVKKAKTVTIVGGGIVGVEIAGELATDYPNLHVTLLHSSEKLISKGVGATAKLQDSVLANLKTFKNITVHLNDRVTTEPPASGFTLEPLTVKTNSGREVTGDITFYCLGQQQPNSEFLEGLGAGARDEKGFVKVKPTGQAVDYPFIFSLGDVSTLDESKTAVAISAGGQGSLISKNLVSLIQTPSAPLKDYMPLTKAMPVPPMVASIGRNGGVAQLPFFGVFGNWTARFLKSRELFASKPWATLNVKELFPQ
ncbi:Apoptosis-inducing factor 2 [Phlyctochytrium bullatum]|nr:Apoptosis-inducing factor 2 [Phlyctochytrium bullatum]